MSARRNLQRLKHTRVIINDKNCKLLIERRAHNVGFVRCVGFKPCCHRVLPVQLFHIMTTPIGRLILMHVNLRAMHVTSLIVGDERSVMK